MRFIFFNLMVCMFFVACSEPKTKGTEESTDQKFEEIVANLVRLTLAGEIQPKSEIEGLDSMTPELVDHLQSMKASLRTGHAYQVADFDYFREREDIDHTLLLSSGDHWIGIRLLEDPSGSMRIIDVRSIREGSS